MHGMASLAQPARGHSLPLAAIVLPALCVAAFVFLIATRPQVPGNAVQAAALDSVLLWNSILPRSVLALVAGAALGLSGTLLQRVLRNPIADASTLGIASGAELAMTAALSFSPLLIGPSREIVAFGGGLGAVAIVLALSWRRGLDPVTVALSGMIVSMIAAALSVTLILARGEYAMSIYIWGAGSLSQQGWDGVITLAPRLVLGFVSALILIRPLRILTLDDSSARSLGLALHMARFAVLALAVWLAASVTAEVGVIGFLGLAAPAIARLLGARSTGSLMIAAPLTGAALLFLTDCLTQILGPGFTDLAPTGAATALLGGPLLLFLLPRVHSVPAVAAQSTQALKRLSKPIAALAVLSATILLLFALFLTLGPSDDGWHMATGVLFTDLLPFRLPRTLVAAGAGGMLAAAGFIMQRVTGNPIASPEVLGISSGAGAGLTVALINTLLAGGEALPACGWLISPWTDLTMSGTTLATKDAIDPLIHKGYLLELAEAYVPPHMDRKDPRVSPLYADLKGMPPLLIQVGSDESLLADATRFAAAAGEADVEVTLEIWPRMIHAWPLWNAKLEAGRQAIAHAGDFIRRCMNGAQR